jgi:hypothetical protein
MNTLEEKKEIVYTCFNNTLDKEMAYTKAGLSEEEVSLLDEDKNFQDRLEYCLIEEKEALITKLRYFRNSSDDKIAYKATLDLALQIYPEFFKKDPKEKTVNNNNININNTSVSPEEKERIHAEYEQALRGTGKVLQNEEQSDSNSG